MHSFKQAHFLLILSILCSVATITYAADNTLSSQEKSDGWQLLFNGKDFSNWKMDKWNTNCFKIEDESIKCYGKASMLYYTKKTNYKNFHFVATVMTKKGANSGIFFHTKYQDKGWPIGHEAQVNCTQKDPVKTGSVYVVKKYLEQAHEDDEWFKYEIIVEGQRIITKVNDKIIADYTETKNDGRRKLSAGTFGLQSHDPGSVVFYKNIKVKELP
ncbi:MAG: DUF1080 domain-containing protein [Lentisphaeraceae bacterium]|nr:DUF1080 domain-containing protein [Lentisphaeraceae bacterium]